MNGFDTKTLLKTAIDCLGILAEDIELTTKFMFGGAMCYTNGRPFCSISNVGIGVKLSPDQRDALLAIEGAKSLRYEVNSPASKTYTLVPQQWHDDFDKLLPILLESAEFCKTLPLPKKRKKKT